ncbi:MAG TPA: M48 family metallopeptidase [Candidatus Polarisedimenticolia bacterium]|nr:M48 family metallopeptidase [Candidatus Polarisedimenticolia bacterium]
MFRSKFVLGWALLLSTSFLSASVAFASPQEQKDKAKDSGDDDKFYHGTGINDLNAIGNRNVGCNRGLGNWYTLDTQVRMGQEFARQVEQTSHLITDPLVNEYVNRLGQNLSRNSDTHLPFTIKVLDVEEPNAFALPGGYMFVNAGTILLADDESELAGVMAHEIGHVAACHAARESTRGTMAGLAMIPVVILTGGLAGIGINQAANYGIPAVFSKFGRNFEAQADYLGVQYAYKSGYDPNGMIDFFEKLQALEKKRPGVAMKLYGDHPQTPDRIAKSQHEIGTILPPREQYIMDTSDFQQAKKRLALIMKHKLLKDDKDAAKPDLRRTAGDKNPGDKNPDQNDKNQNDDRPVIKRKPGNN